MTTTTYTRRPTSASQVHDGATEVRSPFDDAYAANARIGFVKKLGAWGPGPRVEEWVAWTMEFDAEPLSDEETPKRIKGTFVSEEAARRNVEKAYRTWIARYDPTKA